MIRLEFSDGKSHKFWEIEVDGSSHTVRYGRMGSNGQSKTKTFDTPEKAQAAADKLIAQKTKKGYATVGAPVPAVEPAVAPPSATSAVPTEPGRYTTPSGVDYVLSPTEMSKDRSDATRDVIKAGDVEGFKAALLKGAPLSQWSFLAAYAAKEDHRAIIQIFLDMGATKDVNVSARLAAQTGNLELLQLLVRHGAELDHYDPKNNRSVLISAAGNGRLPVVEWVLAQTKIGKVSAASAIRLASQQGHLVVVKHLVEQGIDINGAKGKDQSSVVSAAGRGHSDVLEFLIGNGAKITGGFGDAAIERALKQNQPDTVAFLLEKGVKLTKSGQKRVIGLAAEGGKLDLLLAMHKNGQDHTPKAAKAFLKMFGFLAKNDRDTALLGAMACAVTEIDGTDAPVITFASDVEVECVAPRTGDVAARVPASFAAISRVFNGISWDAGGPMMGYCGLSDSGQTLSDEQGIDAVAEADEAKAKELKEAGVFGAFDCGQNWLMFDPTRKNEHGEPALGFVSHGDCEWVEVNSADGLCYHSVMLRLMADNTIYTRELPEIYA